MNSLPTTVGAIHAIIGGPAPLHPWGYIYKRKPDGSFAAWCWRRVATGYGSYAVGPGTPIFLDIGTNSPPRPGPLDIL